MLSFIHIICYMRPSRRSSPTTVMRLWLQFTAINLIMSALVVEEKDIHSNRLKYSHCASAFNMFTQLHCDGIVHYLCIYINSIRFTRNTHTIPYTITPQLSRTMCGGCWCCYRPKLINPACRYTHTHIESRAFSTDAVVGFVFVFPKPFMAHREPRGKWTSQQRSSR